MFLNGRFSFPNGQCHLYPVLIRGSEWHGRKLNGNPRVKSISNEVILKYQRWNHFATIITNIWFLVQNNFF